MDKKSQNNQSENCLTDTVKSNKKMSQRLKF